MSSKYYFAVYIGIIGNYPVSAIKVHEITVSDGGLVDTLPNTDWTLINKLAI